MMEIDVFKGNKQGIELRQYESVGEFDRTYPITQKRKKQIEFYGEFRKIKPPTFEGEKEEDAESWILNMSKYFKVYEYQRRFKAIKFICYPHGNVSLSLEEAKACFY